MLTGNLISQIFGDYTEVTHMSHINAEIVLIVTSSMELYVIQSQNNQVQIRPFDHLLCVNKPFVDCLYNHQHAIMHLIKNMLDECDWLDLTIEYPSLLLHHPDLTSLSSDFWIKLDELCCRKDELTRFNFDNYIILSKLNN